MIKKIILSALFILPTASFADSCIAFPVQFSDAYAVTTPSNDESLIVYITAKNANPIDSYTITGVSSPGSRSAVFQAYAPDSYNQNTIGVADEIVIPPKGLYIFRPRNLSIVLDGFKDRPNPGDAISLTFTFADSCVETVNNIEVRSPD